MAELRITPLPRVPEGEVLVPRDKSLAHRLAFLAGLARGDSFLRDYPKGQDNQTTLKILSALGAEVRHEPQGVRIRGFFRSPEEPATFLDCENSGTTVRLALGMVSGFPIAACFTGDRSLVRRPMARVTRPLRAMGVQVIGRKGGEHLPLAVQGPPSQGFSGTLEVASAQVKSALLLCGLTSGLPVTLEEPAPTRNHTELLLQWLGYPVEHVGRRLKLEAHLDHQGFSATIPRDPSQAAFFAALALLREGCLRFPELLYNPGRLRFFAWLSAMGAGVTYTPQPSPDSPEPVATVEVQGKVARPCPIPPEEMGEGIDELPLLALFGLVLPQGVEIRGAAELRHKESDRIRTISSVARALGGEVEEYPDGLKVTPGKPPSLARVTSAGDHRIAMASAVFAAGLGIPLVLEEAEAVRISYPGFYEELERLGVAQLTWNVP